MCDHCHIRCVLAAFMDFGVGAFLIFHVQHDGREHDMTVKVFLGNAHVGRNTHHVAHDAVRICTVFHQDTAYL